MSDLPPEPPEKPPLEYWHADYQPPRSAFGSVFALLGGVMFGLILTSIVSAMALGATVSFGGIYRQWIAGAIAGLSFCFFALRVIYRLTTSSFPEQDGKGSSSKYFKIGFLIGSGLACLLTGLCFTAIG